MKKMKKKYRVIIGIAIIVGVLSYLILSSFSSTKVYYYTLDEFEGLQLDPEQRVRISGKLVRESVDYDPGGPLLRFVLRGRDSTFEVAISYEDAMPDNFMRSEEVVVTGYLAGEKFMAESMLIKCPSKYEAQLKEES